MTSPVSPTSAVLVSLQFVLLAVLAWPIGPWGAGPGWWLGALLVFASLALATWALVAMRPGTFSVMPEPVRDGRLCTRGPYAAIRHPMYTAVLLAGLGLNLMHGTAWQWLALLALAIVLLGKIRREERLLERRFDQYPAYRRRTGALLPQRPSRKPDAR